MRIAGKNLYHIWWWTSLKKYISKHVMADTLNKAKSKAKNKWGYRKRQIPGRDTRVGGRLVTKRGRAIPKGTRIDLK